MDAKVIVAGAGPAGAVAARTLAAAGIDTLLVDRAAFPRNKPCGGGISVRALRRFPWLESVLADVDVHRVSRLHLEGPRGATFNLESDDPSVILIRRVEFDHALVRAAEEAGARLSTGVELTQARQDRYGVTLQARDGRQFRAAAVVAADGVHSVVAKRLGVNLRWPRTHVAIDMMEETPVDVLRADRPDVLWVAYAYQGLEGYAYIFPKTRHVNVGIGCVLAHFDERGPERPYEMQERFVSSLVRSGTLHGRSDRAHFTPFLIPVGGPLKRAHRGRVLFAGDAGGFVNGFTAEGIYYAMISGELAGRALAAAGADPAAGPRYDRLWQTEVGTELRDAALVQRYLFASEDRVRRAIRGGMEIPGLAGMVLAYVQGTLPYTAIRRQVIRRFPLAAFRIARELFRVRRTGRVAAT